MFVKGMRVKLGGVSLCALAMSAFGQPILAQEVDEPAAEKEAVLGTVTVTARGREESLQDIPESIIALDSAALEARGIVDIEGVVNQTSNFFVRETFRAGATFFTIRGISTGQQGWAPITYSVDGVKSATLDAINQGALFDVERVEVLKGPQGGLYGAGAIAGAINVITKKPTNEYSGQVVGSLAEGGDKILKGSISGPIVEDKLLFRLSGYVRDKDGLTKTVQGDEIDFEKQSTIRGRLIYTPIDTLSIDVRGSYSDIEAGAVTQSRFESINQVNSFSDSLLPSRGILGAENRKFVDLSAKIDWELPFGTLSSTTGKLDLDQDLFGTVSWTAQPALGDAPVIGLFGPIFGPNALPVTDPLAFTTPFDQLQNLIDNFEVFTQDIRLVSNSDQRLRWLVGTEFVNRQAEQGLSVGFLLGPQGDTPLYLLNRVDDKEDNIWGVFGQLQYDITDRFEFTLSARYDENEFSTVQRDGASGAVVAQLNKNGDAVNELSAKDSAFQPKVTLAYDLNDDLKLYGTYARGFRFGFFNTGNRTQAESTDNFEIGFRSTLADGALNLNGSAFYIDYSNQQVTSVIATPPFRQTANIPDTEIRGVEMDFNWDVAESFQFNGSFGYLNAERSDGGEVPVTPKWTANLGGQYTHPLDNGLDLISRADWRYQGEHFSLDGGGIRYDIDAANLIDVRIGVQSDHWKLVGFAKNLTDEQTALDPGFLGAFFVRDYTDPRQVGVELSVDF
jgi:iron complex outermembrane recepter protein